MAKLQKALSKEDSLPLLSAGIATIWLVVGLVVQFNYGPLLRESREAHFQAARMVARDPTIAVSDDQMRVVRAVNPHFENDSLLEFMRKKSDRSQVELAQSTFDGIVETAISTLNQHPFRRLGLIPAEGAAVGLAAHVLIHDGILHLIASVILLMLVAPLLEKRWGPLLLAVNTSLIVLASAGAYMLCHPDSNRALAGGSALIAGLVAAVLIRQKDEPVVFLQWLSPWVKTNLSAPVWALGGVWLVYEASLWVIGQGALPRGIDNAVGYSAHAAGAVIGGGLALLIAALGLEKSDAPATQGASGSMPRKAAHFDLKRALALRASGDTDRAFFMLEAEVERSARNRDVVMAYWDVAIELQQTKKAAPAVVRLIEEEMRRGADAVASRIWGRLREHAPDVLLDAPTLIRLIPSLGREQGEEAVTIALRQALNENNRGLTPSLAAKAARIAVEVNTLLAAEAAKRALSAKNLDDKTRAEMKMLAEALAPNRPESAYSQTSGTKPQASAFFEETDRSAFGEATDLSEMAREDFPDGAITQAVPDSVTAEGFAVVIEGVGRSVIAFSRMRALAVVAVHGLGPKPVVLLDILIDGGGDDHPLTLLRMRCDRFDPRILAPEATSQQLAMRSIVQKLAEQGVQVLADITAQTTDAKPLFESIDAYHDKVIRPTAQQFA